MIKTFKKLLSFLNPSLKKLTMMLSGFIVINMFVETFSIALIVPLVSLFYESEVLEKYPIVINALTFVSPFRLFSNADFYEIGKRDIVAGGILLFFLFYLVKTAYVLFFHIYKENFILKTSDRFTQLFIRGYLSLPYSFFVGRNTSQLIRNIIPESAVLTSCLSFFLLFFTEISVLLGILFLLIYMQPLTTIIIIFIFTAASFYFHKFTKRKLSKTGEIRMNREERRHNLLNQTLGGIKEIKIYNSENDFISKYILASTEVFKSAKWQNIITTLPKLWLELIAVLCFTILILILLFNSENQYVVFSTLAIFAAATFRCLPSISRIINSIQKIKYYYPSINFLYNESKKFSDIDDNSNDKVDFSKNLTLKNIDFFYEGKKKVLDKINLNIPKYSTIGLMGETGVGKSTLGNILVGLSKFNSGSVYVDGIEFKNKKINWANRIGYVPQNVFLINDTLRRNIAFGIPDEEINEKQIINSINFSQLDNLVKNLPNGLNTFIGERGSKLSGGQIQRIGIARALYHDPDFLVFDEATSALDIDTENKFIKVIQKILNKKTVFIISHRESALKICDEIYELKNRKIYKRGI